MKTIGIIASGPSLTRSDAELLIQLCDEVGTVNSSYRISDHSSWIYTNDGDWLIDEWNNGELKKYKGDIYCGDPEQRDYPDSDKINRSFIFDKKIIPFVKHRNRLSWGGNSGHAAIDLAYNRGATRIILLGYDMQGKDFEAHWHGKHSEKVRKPFNWPMWHANFGALAIEAEKKGLEILNATRETALTCFKKVDLGEIK